jgi:hypothetical protein
MQNTQLQVLVKLPQHSVHRIYHKTRTQTTAPLHQQPTAVAPLWLGATAVALSQQTLTACLASARHPLAHMLVTKPLANPAAWLCSSRLPT